MSAQPNYGRDCKHLSDSAVDLLKRLLKKTSKERVSAREALQHPWFSNRPVEAIDQSICENLKTYKSYARLKNVLINMMAHQLDFSGKQIDHIDKVFNTLDSDKSGTLSSKELTQGLKAAGLQEWEISRIIRALDIDDSESVSYTEFLAAAYSWKESELNIVWTAFNRLDTDHDGVISLEELASLLLGPAGSQTRLLKRRSDHEDVLIREVNELLHQIDKNGDGKVDWEEFLEYMRGSALESSRK